MQNIQVLHIIKSLGRGGAERLLAETIQEHSPGFKFSVVYFLPWKNQMVGDLEESGARVINLSASSNIQILFKLPALISLISNEKFNLIHCHLPWAGIVGRVAGKIVGVPTLYTEHNNVFTYHPATRFLHRIKFNWFKKIIAVSYDAERAIQKFNSNTGKPLTILNGVNTDKFNRDLYNKDQLRIDLKIPRNCKVISTVAVFREQKKLNDWLSIAASLIDKRTDVYFFILGDGPLKEALIKQSESLSLTNQLKFTGLVNDPRKWLACTDIFLMSSAYEGLPVALLEAMSMECAPVVTNVGGIPDVVNSENGFLFSPGDIDQAVSYINDILDESHKLRTLSIEARKMIIDKYSLKRMVSELEQTYREVLK